MTVGEAFEDLVFLDLPRLPRLGEEIKTDRFLRSPGGGAVITAIAASRLGSRCRVVSGLGDGAVAVLRGEGVEVHNLRRPHEAHALSAALSTRRDRSFVTFNGVNDRLEPRFAAAARREKARHLHFAFYPRDCGRWERIVASARRRGLSTSWDFGWNEGLVRDPGFPAPGGGPGLRLPQRGRSPALCPAPEPAASGRSLAGERSQRHHQARPPRVSVGVALRRPERLRAASAGGGHHRGR